MAELPDTTISSTIVVLTGKPTGQASSATTAPSQSPRHETKQEPQGSGAKGQSKVKKRSRGSLLRWGSRDEDGVAKTEKSGRNRIKSNSSDIQEHQLPMETAETTPAGIKESGSQADPEIDELLPKLGKLKKVAKANKELTKQNTQLQSTVDSLREERDALQSEQERLKRDRMSLERELNKYRQGSLEVEVDTTELEEKIERLEAKVAEKEEQRASLHRKLELQIELYTGNQAARDGQGERHGADFGAPKSRSSSMRDAGCPSLTLDRLLEEQDISSRLRKENGELKLRITSLEAELEHVQQQLEEATTGAVKHRRASTFFRRGEKKHRSATAIVRRPNQPERSQSPDTALSASNSYQDFDSRKRSVTADSPLNSPVHSPRTTHRNTVSSGSSKAGMSSLQSCLKLALEEKKSAEEQKKELEEELSRARERIKQLQKSTAQTRNQSSLIQETEVLKQSLKLALSEKSSFEEHLESLQKEVDSLAAQNKSQEKALSDFTAQRDSRQQELERENEQLRKKIEQLKSSASKPSPDQRASRRKSIEKNKELPPQVTPGEEKSKVVTEPPKNKELSPQTAPREEKSKVVTDPLKNKELPPQTAPREEKSKVVTNPPKNKELSPQVAPREEKSKVVTDPLKNKELPPQTAPREEKSKVVTNPPKNKELPPQVTPREEKSKVVTNPPKNKELSPQVTPREEKSKVVTSPPKNKELSPQTALREEKSRVVTKPPPSPSAVSAKPLNREKTPDKTASSRPARRDSVDKTKDVGSKKVAATRALFEEKIEGEKAQAEASSPKRLRRKSSSGSTNALFTGGQPTTPTSSPSHTPAKSTHAPLTPQRSSNSSLNSPSTSPPTAPKPLNRSHAPLSSQRSGNSFPAKVAKSSSCSTATTTSPTVTTPTSNSSLTAKPPGSKVSIISVKTSVSPSSSPRLSTRKQIKEIVVCSPKMEKKSLPGSGFTHAKSNSFDAPKLSSVEPQSTKPPVTKSLSFSQQVTVYPQTTSPSTATPASPSAKPSQQWRSSATPSISTTTPKISTTSTKTVTTTVKTEKVTIKQMPGKLCVPNSVEVRRASSLQDIPERVSSSSSSTGNGMVSGPNRSGVQLRANRRGGQRERPKTLCHTETTNLVNLISKMREQDNSVRQQPRMIVNGAMNGEMDGSSTNGTEIERHPSSKPPPSERKLKRANTFAGGFDRRSKKALLLKWCQQITINYDNVDIANFGESFGDGLAFCAILHYFIPAKIPYSSLNEKSRERNFRVAFEAAESVGIPSLLDIEDMVALPIPDWMSVMTYVSFIYNKFGQSVPVVLMT